MLNLRVFPWRYPLLAVTFTLMGLSYVIASLILPYDGARLEPGKKSWLPNGVRVDPVNEIPDGLQAGDTILAVDNKKMEEWGEALVHFDFRKPAEVYGQAAEYEILRYSRLLELTAAQSAFPLVVLFERYWGLSLAELTIIVLMSYLLIRRPAEPAAQALFIFAWSLWNFPPWVMGIQVRGIQTVWGYWHYRLVTNFLVFMSFSSLVHISLVFPQRHYLLKRMRRMIPLVYVAPFLFFGVYMSIARFYSTNAWTWLSHWNSGEWAVGTVYMLLFAIMIFLNYREIQDEESRLKARWVALSWLFFAGGLIFLWMIPGAFLGSTILPTNAIGVLFLPIPLAMVTAILRHRLFDLNIILNRALVYGTLTTVIICVYVVVVGYAGSFLHSQAIDHSRNDIVFSLIAAAIIAVIFLPLRDRLQRAVNRMMYGERDDPYAVLSRLGKNLEAAGSVETMLPTIVETIRQALNLPYVAIVFRDEHGSRLAAACGTHQNNRQHRLPLTHQNVTFGDLVLEQRSETETFTRTEMNLLADLACQVEVAAHNVLLAADLRLSQQKLITQREEERRRIRRDLHDEIGPLLASQSLTLEAIEKMIERDPTAATALVRDLKKQSQGAVHEIRRIIYDLRPPSLDDLGLIGALSEHFTQFALSKPEVELVVDANLPALSAAVETAVYRITIEAVNNVFRHADANRCRVSLHAQGDLVLTINDDGLGLPAKYHTGVGLRAMQERAKELGGSFQIESPTGNGTLLVVRLPLAIEGK